MSKLKEKAKQSQVPKPQVKESKTITPAKTDDNKKNTGKTPDKGR